MRLVVCDNGLVSRSGHHYNLTRALLDSARERQLATLVAACERVDADIVAELDVRPTFRFTPYQTYDKAYQLGARRVETAGRFARDLEQLELRAQDLVLLPNARAAEVIGLNEFLSRRGPSRPSAVCLNFMSEGVSLGGLTPHGRSTAAAYGRGLRGLARLLRDRLVVTGNSEALASQMARVARYPVRHFASLKPLPPPTPRTPRSDGPAIVVCPGAFLPRRGANLLAPIARRSRTLECRFVVQALGAADRDVANALAELATLANVELVPIGLSAEEYFALFASADVVLLPYRAADYRAMISGVFAEAVAIGRAVVVPTDTWMAEQLARGFGAGSCFERHEPESIVLALSQTLERLDELSEQASDRTSLWRAENGVETYLDRVLAELAVAGVPAS